MSEKNQESNLEEAAEHASKAADLADKASAEAHEAVDKVREVTGQESASGRASSDAADKLIDPPDTTGGGGNERALPGESSVTRPDY